MHPFHKTLLCAPLAGLLLAGATLAPPARAADGAGKDTFMAECAECHSATPVSYTHLTLPTICSV